MKKLVLTGTRRLARFRFRKLRGTLTMRETPLDATHLLSIHHQNRNTGTENLCYHIWKHWMLIQHEFFEFWTASFSRGSMFWMPEIDFTILFLCLNDYTNITYLIKFRKHGPFQSSSLKRESIYSVKSFRKRYSFILTPTIITNLKIIILLLVFSQ